MPTGAGPDIVPSLQEGPESDAYAAEAPQKRSYDATMVDAEDGPDDEEAKSRAASKRRRLSTFAETTAPASTLHIRPVPWHDWNVWLQLKTLLDRNDDVGARRLLALLTLHRRSATPIAVSASVSLRTLLNNRDSVPTHTRRLAIAMAIARFINGMTDLLQPSSAQVETISVSDIAASLKLPPVLVEIRHHATHRGLPPLPTLLYGAREALRWLDEHYWSPQLKRLRTFKLLRTDTLTRLNRLASVFAHESYERRRDDARSAGEDFGSVGADTRPRSRTVSKKTLSQMVRFVCHWHQFRRRERNDKVVRAGGGRDRRGSLRSDGERANIWEECRDRKKWISMPIGLMPQQKHVPPVHMSYFVRADDATGKGIGADAYVGDGDQFANVADDDSCDSEDEFMHESLILQQKAAKMKRDEVQRKKNVALKEKENDEGEATAFERKFADVIAQEVAKLKDVIKS